MQFVRMLLMCSALITLAYSFPTYSQKNISTTHINDTNAFKSKENERPFVLILEEKDPNSESVVVQFVYSNNDGNSIIKTTGNDKDKYIIDIPIQTQNDKKTRVNDERKLDQDSITQKTTQGHNNKLKSHESQFQISPLTSLEPEEESLLSNRWPKYFHDSFNPVKPFPELQTQKLNKIITNKATKENHETRTLNNGKERKEIPFVAGPQLNPLSIYDRVFYEPIFE